MTRNLRFTKSPWAVVGDDQKLMAEQIESLLEAHTTIVCTDRGTWEAISKSNMQRITDLYRGCLLLMNEMAKSIKVLAGHLTVSEKMEMKEPAYKEIIAILQHYETLKEAIRITETQLENRKE